MIFNPLVVLFPSVELNDNILTHLSEPFCSLRKWRHPKAGEAQHGDKKRYYKGIHLDIEMLRKKKSFKL